jgi:hypothetical protein
MMNKKVRVARFHIRMAAAFALLCAGILTGCASVDAAPSNVLKVGSSEVPYVQIAKIAEPIAARDGKLMIEPFEIDLALSDKALRREFPVRKRYAIRDLEIPADFYAPLPDKDISVNLNIISGRKSSPDNLLRCGILEGRLSELVGRRFYLKGRLIRE